MMQLMGELKISIDQVGDKLEINRGDFPVEPQQNPRGNQQNGPPTLGFDHHEHASAVTTLRSGKVIRKNITVESEKEQEPIDEEVVDDEIEEEKSGEEISPIIEIAKQRIERNKDIDTSKYNPPVPYPQRLVKPNEASKNQDLLELFKSVNINLPLLDAVKQVPSYAKFLKDLCTQKPKQTMKKKAYLACQVSSIIKSDMPMKLKDPGTPTISCVIGNQKIHGTLIDLGASVNLLPYSVYQ